MPEKQSQYVRLLLSALVSPRRGYAQVELFAIVGVQVGHAQNAFKDRVRDVSAQDAHSWEEEPGERLEAPTLVHVNETHPRLCKSKSENAGPISKRRRDACHRHEGRA
eukprot:scaffold436_cov267-Pinguiococcus_pyrenoidosus.AAC.2